MRIYTTWFAYSFFPLHRHNPGRMRDGNRGRVLDLRLEFVKMVWINKGVEDTQRARPTRLRGNHHQFDKST